MDSIQSGGMFGHESIPTLSDLDPSNRTPDQDQDRLGRPPDASARLEVGAHAPKLPRFGGVEVGAQVQDSAMASVDYMSWKVHVSRW